MYITDKIDFIDDEEIKGNDNEEILNNDEISNDLVAGEETGDVVGTLEGVTNSISEGLV